MAREALHRRCAFALSISALVALALGAGCGPEDEGAAPAEENDGGVAVATVSQPVTLAPIFAVADTSVRQAAQFANDGQGYNLSTSSVAGSVQRSLIRFDQAAIATAVGSQSLYRARVELTITGMSAGWGGGPLEIHAMTRSWPEGNGTYGGFGTHGPSFRCADDTDTSTFGNLFNNCTPANKWGMLPGDPDPLPFATASTDTARLTSNGMTLLGFDVTTDIRRFLTGDPNYGFLVKDTAGPLHGQWVHFASRETTTPGSARRSCSVASASSRTSVRWSAVRPSRSLTTISCELSSAWAAGASAAGAARVTSTKRSAANWWERCTCGDRSARRTGVVRSQSS
jgi:hypothetical protein